MGVSGGKRQVRIGGKLDEPADLEPDTAAHDIERVEKDIFG